MNPDLSTKLRLWTPFDATEGKYPLIKHNHLWSSLETSDYRGPSPRSEYINKLFQFQDQQNHRSPLKYKKNTLKLIEGAARINFQKDILKPIQRLVKKSEKIDLDTFNEEALKVAEKLGSKLKAFDVQASLANMANNLIGDFRSLIQSKNNYNDETNKSFDKALTEGYHTLTSIAA